MIDRGLIGLQSGSSEILIETLPLKQFARAIGESNPVYFDRAAAIAAGYPGILVPPTYIYCLESLATPPGMDFVALGIPVERLLHAEQTFSYFHRLFSGDRIRLQMRIVDVYEKRNGALEFLETETSATLLSGVLAVQCTSKFAIKHD